MSLFFYGWWSVKAIPLLLFSIFVNYLLAGKLSPFDDDNEKTRKTYLYLGLAFNLLLLAFFKYVNFFIDNTNTILSTLHQPRLPALNIILPLGISFYTFTQIAFLVDCWAGKVKERNFMHYLLFVTYFPHLIAGPILHHSQMMPQFSAKNTYKINLENIAEGLTLFSLGLAKKIVIADSLAGYVNQAFDHAGQGTIITFVDGWAAALSYALQLYFDFSGYCDMAIGLSLFFGIRLPMNFNSPYKATSIIEFWRRWHISLSTFLRDYLYIPLGGNRLGPFRRYLNLFIAMILGGLWHGANWTFVIWGGAHGVFLIINHLWRKWSPSPLSQEAKENKAVMAIYWLVTFLCVCFAWVMFRSDSVATAFAIYKGMIGANGFVLPEQILQIMPVAQRLFHAAGNMPTLGGGSIMGFFNELVLLLIGFAMVLAGKQIAALNYKSRLVLIAATTGFIVNSIFFAVPQEFMYFQF